MKFLDNSKNRALHSGESFYNGINWHHQLITLSFLVLCGGKRDAIKRKDWERVCKK